MMKSLICLSLFLLPLFVTVSVAAESDVVGGWKSIEDINDAYVAEIAKFAVSEHNKQTKQNLVYGIVAEGKEQMVAGTRYDLIIYVINGEAEEEYEVVVVDKPWKRSRTLESFKAV